MSNIARKLCHDIVDPILKPSSTNSKNLKFSEKSVKTFTNNTNNVKQRQILQLDKKKCDKIEPSIINAPTTNKVKYEKSIKNKSVNSGTNTLCSGPLKCDNNCITLIHKRDHQICCKCHNLKTNVKGCSKEIQTLNRKNYSISDKSCSQCLETASHGTQFTDNRIIKQYYKRRKSNIEINIHDNKVTHKLRTKSLKLPLLNEGNLESEKPIGILKSPNLEYTGKNHWALSNYPIRGPDF